MGQVYPFSHHTTHIAPIMKKKLA